MKIKRMSAAQLDRLDWWDIYIGAKVPAYKEKDGALYWVTISRQHLLVDVYIDNQGMVCDKEMNAHMAKINEYQTSSTRCRLRDIGLVEYAGSYKVDGRTQMFWRTTRWGHDVAERFRGTLH